MGRSRGGFVNLVNQHHAAGLRRGGAADSLAQAPVADEAALELVGREQLPAVLAVLEMAQGVVLVEQVVGRGAGLGGESQGFAQVEEPGQVLGQLGLARARLAGEQQGQAQLQGHVDRVGQFGRGLVELRRLDARIGAKRREGRPLEGIPGVGALRPGLFQRICVRFSFFQRVIGHSGII